MFKYVSKYGVKKMTWTPYLILNYFETYSKCVVKYKILSINLLNRLRLVVFKLVLNIRFSVSYQLLRHLVSCLERITMNGISVLCVSQADMLSVDIIVS